jgi:hypothetical protein
MLSAAEADFNYTRSKEGVGQLTMSTRSIGGVRTLWKMDAQHTAAMQVATLRPLEAKQTEIYKKETVITTLHFTPEGVTRLREKKPPEPKTPKPRDFLFPRVYDLHSTYHFLRSQKLAAGDVYSLVVYPATTPYLAQLTVGARQKLRVAGQSWNAIRVDLKLWKISDELELESHGKFKRGTAWISDDADRIPLRLESDIHVGSVWGEVDKIEWK